MLLELVEIVVYIQTNVVTQRNCSKQGILKKKLVGEIHLREILLRRF